MMVQGGGSWKNLAKRVVLSVENEGVKVQIEAEYVTGKRLIKEWI